MAEYIEREALIKKYTKKANKAPSFADCRFYTLFIKHLLQCPAADVVEVRHGEWKNDGKDWFCNRCNHNALCDKMTGEEVLSAICPHCGAKMDEE